MKNALARTLIEEDNRSETSLFGCRQTRAVKEIISVNHGQGMDYSVEILGGFTVWGKNQDIFLVYRYTRINSR